jgi:hypothetical protein
MDIRAGAGVLEKRPDAAWSASHSSCNAPDCLPGNHQRVHGSHGTVRGKAKTPIDTGCAWRGPAESEYRPHLASPPLLPGDRGAFHHWSYYNRSGPGWPRERLRSR